MARLGSSFSPFSAIVAQEMPISRLRRWGGRLLTVFIGHGALQTINFLVGFLLVRWLSVDDFAEYSVVFGFQTTLGLLIDLGFGGCIVSLVGPRGDRPEVIGEYIAAARWYRYILLVILGPFAALVFWRIGHIHGWSKINQIALFVCVIFSLYFQGPAGWFSAPLLIHQRLRLLLGTQCIAAAGRLGFCGLFRLCGVLSATTLACISSLTVAWTAFRNFQTSRSLVRVPQSSSPQIRRDMRHYIMPLIPTVAFTALQGQLSLFLISLFGKSHNIAEVAALGRLGQLFSLLGAFNATLVEPYFARLEHALLYRRYLQVCGGVVLLASAVSAIGFTCPSILLWVLGEKYDHLRDEFGWMIAGNCVAYVAGVLWTINSARKWIFWWATILYIAAVTVVQSLFIAMADLSTTLSVFYFALATAATILVVHAITAIYGYRHDVTRTLPA